MAEARVPLPAKAGHPARDDSEDSRTGMRTLWLFWEPLRGYRQMAAPDQRPMQDFARPMTWLGDEGSPEAELLRVVLATLNTQQPAAQYETCAPAEARRLLRQLACHDTPTPGSWWNSAESALSVFSRQCLDRRIGDEDTLQRAIKQWEEERHAVSTHIEWRVTTDEARQQSPRLYSATAD
jgi:hypothetical protein